MKDCNNDFDGETQALEPKGNVVHPQVRLRFSLDKPFFGPGVYELLLLVDQTGSLQEACQCMHMSYSKGSRMVKEAESRLGFPLTRRWTGGNGGGGSMLTEEGEYLLEQYDKMLVDIQTYTDSTFKKYFGDKFSCRQPE